MCYVCYVCCVGVLYVCVVCCGSRLLCSGQPPKSVLCQFFKKGQCVRFQEVSSAKCYFTMSVHVCMCDQVSVVPVKEQAQRVWCFLSHNQIPAVVPPCVCVCVCVCVLCQLLFSCFILHSSQPSSPFLRTVQVTSASFHTISPLSARLQSAISTKMLRQREEVCFAQN